VLEQGFGTEEIFSGSPFAIEAAVSVAYRRLSGSQQ
jgi:hypothetical protein